MDNKLVHHAWHGAKPGDHLPEQVNAVIEISKGSRGKYELDKETGLLRLDRVLYPSMHYPANYGFIPQSLGEDNDPMDILVLSQVEIRPLCLVHANVIGVMRMVDNNEIDDKIIAVAASDPAVAHVKHIDQLPDYLIQELRSFFENYTRLENKKVLVEGFQAPEIAHTIIMDSIKRYKNTYMV